jgi:hypothetical protein
MIKEFVPYELSVKLKSLGFDEKCFCNWEESWSPEPEHEIRMVLTTDQTWLRPGWVHAPTFSQAFRWFRENYGLMHIINPYYFTAEINHLNERVVDEKYGDFIPHDHLVDDEGEEIKHLSYEKAELACLDKLIEIVETKQQEQ